MSNETLGQKIRNARKSLKMSAGELGQQLDPTVTSTAIYKWEKDKAEPGISHMQQLQEILGINVAELFTKSDEPSRIEYYFAKMTDDQKDAVINVARAMVE